jgi:tRNA 5-methylaminomethyl-2-thiouridine biosynthesis bifunctional protein
MFDDVYFAESDGIEESTYVYLEGSGYLESLKSGSPLIRIGEIGFGVGLNFILTLKAFLEHSSPEQRLEYFSFEKFPVMEEDLHRLYREYPDLTAAAEMLLSQYPLLTPGIHSISFLDGRVKLYLGLGDAKELLEKTEFMANHWYWDGFAPNRNPEAFSMQIFEEISRHSAIGAQGASFTSAGWVRRALEDNQFKIRKRKGYGHKRECISALFGGIEIHRHYPQWFSNERLKRARPEDGPIAVLGAGLAGSAIARALADRGFHVRVFDPHGVANRASGNSAGLFNVQLSKLPNPISRFTQLALASFMRERKHLHVPARLGIQRTDDKGTEMPEACEYPDSFFEKRDRGLFFPECGMINPKELVKKRLMHHLISVIPEGVTGVVALENEFELVLQGGKINSGNQHVIYALGADSQLPDENLLIHPVLDQLPTRPIRGQTILVNPTESSRDLSTILVNEGYASPIAPEITGHQHHLIGATYQLKDIEPDQESKDRKKLLDESQKWSEFQGLLESDIVTSKIGFRMSTPDKLPLIGPLCDEAQVHSSFANAFRGSTPRELPPLPVCSGEWVLTGMGSRGITYSSLSAEILACLMTGSPLPIESDLWEHLHSARFFIRNLKRGGVS